jgi:hypothetical protein
MTGAVPYFAYGSNLSVTQMLVRCPGAALIGVALLPGRRLAFTRHSQRWGGGVADVVLDPAAEVWGLLYTVTPQDLDALDAYEGRPWAYDRFRVRVEGPAGPRTGVWTYAVTNKSTFIPPSRSYLSVMQEAAREFGFPDHYTRALDAVDTAEA